MSDTIFIKGLYINKKSDKTPYFIKLRLSVKSKEFVGFLKEYTNESGYVNFDLVKSKDGKLYFKLNTWKKEDGRDDKGFADSQNVDDVNPDDIPF